MLTQDARSVNIKAYRVKRLINSFEKKFKKALHIMYNTNETSVKIGTKKDKYGYFSKDKIGFIHYDKI